MTRRPTSTRRPSARSSCRPAPASTTSASRSTRPSSIQMTHPPSPALMGVVQVGPAQRVPLADRPAGQYQRRPAGLPRTPLQGDRADDRLIRRSRTTGRQGRFLLPLGRGAGDSASGVLEPGRLSPLDPAQLCLRMGDRHQAIHPEPVPDPSGLSNSTALLRTGRSLDRSVGPSPTIGPRGPTRPTLLHRLAPIGPRA